MATLPSKGGSYRREKDGSLTRVEESAPAAKADDKTKTQPAPSSQPTK